jgi:SAM-dependent methyltransferase
MQAESDQNLSMYARHAGVLALKFNSITTDAVAPEFVEKVVAYDDKPDMHVLDLACGTGRDSRWMAELGFNVVAVDGSAEMLEQAEKTNPHANVQYLHDYAPAMENTRALGQKFDIILMSAFLFHLDVDDRQDFYETLSVLANVNAYAYMTLRHGPVDEGWTRFDVFPEELEELANDNHDMGYNYLGRHADPRGRRDTSWDHVELNFKVR